MLKGLYTKNKLIVNLIIISLIILFFPYFVFDDVSIWVFKSNLNYYEKFAPFLSIPLSMVTVVLVYKAYLSQKEELEKTSKALDEQSKYLKKQQFESTFFHLINTKTQMLSGIVENSQKMVRTAGHSTFENELLIGDSAIGYKLRKFDSRYPSYFSSINSSYNFEEFKKLFKEFYDELNPSIHKYFQFLVVASSYIRKNDTGDKTYNFLINSTLSKNEYILFLYYIYFYLNEKTANKISNTLLLFNSISREDFVDGAIYDDIYNKFNLAFPPLSS